MLIILGFFLKPAAFKCFSNDDWEDLPVQMVVVSAGIKPRDDLARDTDIAVGERGGIVVDEQVRSYYMKVVSCFLLW